MTEFEIGDRVITTYHIENEDLENKCGVIIAFNDNADEKYYLVEFDVDFEEGHNGDNDELNNNRGWYCRKDEIVKIIMTTPPLTLTNIYGDLDDDNSDNEDLDFCVDCGEELDNCECSNSDDEHDYCNDENCSICNQLREEIKTKKQLPKVDFRGHKVRIKNKTQSKKIQETLFKLGFSWLGIKEVSYISAKFIYIEKDYHLKHDSDEVSFCEDKNREIKAQDILDLKITISRKKSYYIGVISTESSLRYFKEHTEKSFKEYINFLSSYKKWRVFKVKLTETQADEINNLKNMGDEDREKAEEIIRKNKSIIWLSKEVFK